MARRHQEALQAHARYGPVNPSGVMHTFIQACDELVSENTPVSAIKSDIAARLLALSVDSLIFSEELESQSVFTDQLKASRALGGARYDLAVDVLTRASATPIEIAQHFIDACRDARQSSVEDVRRDPSVRLIGLAMRRIMNVSDLLNSGAYDAALSICEEKFATNHSRARP